MWGSMSRSAATFATASFLLASEPADRSASRSRRVENSRASSTGDNPRRRAFSAYCWSRRRIRSTAAWFAAGTTLHYTWWSSAAASGTSSSLSAPTSCASGSGSPARAAERSRSRPTPLPRAARSKADARASPAVAPSATSNPGLGHTNGELSLRWRPPILARPAFQTGISTPFVLPGQRSARRTSGSGPPQSEFTVGRAATYPRPTASAFRLPRTHQDLRPARVPEERAEPHRSDGEEGKRRPFHERRSFL